MTLFWRIFISFWLAALLLAMSFFVLGRFSSTRIIDQQLAALQAQADIVATLWKNQDRKPAAMHWLMQQRSGNNVTLLDAQGRNPFMRFNRMQRDHPPASLIKPGVSYGVNGVVTLAARLPDISPPLYLVRRLQASQIHAMPMPLMLVIAVIVIALVSYILAAMLVKRIHQLRQAVATISQGDLSARVHLTGRDEVSELAQEFNRMAERINEMIASQRQLVSDVSHELRSPLARLRIALELAERAEQPQAMLNKIGKEADELEQLVSSLLSLARMESGQSVLEKQPVKPCALLHKIIDDANFEGEAGNRKVVLEHCDEQTLRLDPVLIQSAIENVIRNALRYTPQGGQVTVRAEKSAQQFRILVEDQGPGVPAKELERLFEPFARVGQARDRNSGGYGLGLAITGKALIAHGGQARAENRSEGGLRVILSLPHSEGRGQRTEDRGV